MSTKTEAPLEAREPHAKWLLPDSAALRRDPEFLQLTAGDPEAQALLKPALAGDVGERIRAARGNMSRLALAHRLCVHENTVGKIERGETLPDAVQLMQLAAFLNRSVPWILGYEQAAEPLQEPPPSVEAVDVGSWVFVPVFETAVSAGHGAFDSSECVEAMRPFSRNYLREGLGIKHNHIGLVRVVGDSMEPEIHSGDVVLLDRLDASAAVEGPHLVRIDGALMVKALQRKPGGRVRVSSRNPAYEAFEVQLADEGSDFQVLGRVRWAGVTFR